MAGARHGHVLYRRLFRSPPGRRESRQPAAERPGGGGQLRLRAARIGQHHRSHSRVPPRLRAGPAAAREPLQPAVLAALRRNHRRRGTAPRGHRLGPHAGAHARGSPGAARQRRRADPHRHPVERLAPPCLRLLPDSADRQSGPHPLRGAPVLAVERQRQHHQEDPRLRGGLPRPLQDVRGRGGQGRARAALRRHGRPGRLHGRLAPDLHGASPGPEAADVAGLPRHHRHGADRVPRDRLDRRSGGLRPQLHGEAAPGARVQRLPPDRHQPAEDLRPALPRAADPGAEQRLHHVRLLQHHRQAGSQDHAAVERRAGALPERPHARGSHRLRPRQRARDALRTHGSPWHRHQPRGADQP
ncbi:hypothetical protein D3C72_965950 [compost metagenome]